MFQLNKKMIIYLSSAVVVAIAAGIIFTSGSDQQVPEPVTPDTDQQVSSNPDIEPTSTEDNPIILSVENITVEPIDSTQSRLQVIFDAYNPNIGTIILESIQYKVLVNNSEVASGEIGERLEGFLASQGNVFPVISSGTVTLTDTDLLTRNSGNAELWEELNSNEIESYQVDGSYSFSQTSTLQASGGDRSFSLIFP
jgi:hypothetical protein